MSPVQALLCVLAAYLLGSVSFALLIAKGRGIDLRQVGSGNLGATNVGRAIGRPAGFLVYLLDFLKGFVPVMLALKVLPTAEAPFGDGWLPLPMLMGAAAFLGHCFPFYLQFKGGKGVATASGVILAISWPTFLIAVGAFALSLAVFRIISVSSIVAALVLPVAFLAVERKYAIELPQLAYLTFFLLIGILVLVRHRMNIHRIIEGTEPKLGSPVK